MMISVARSLKLKITPLCYEPLILDKQRVGGIAFHKHHFHFNLKLKFGHKYVLRKKLSFEIMRGINVIMPISEPLLQ